jgi:hypothetical protein
VVWALVVVVVIGVGLPVGAWAVTRKLPPPRPGNRLGVGYDSIDKWLLNRYQLPPHDRWRVREAVLGGHKVSDPRLAGAAHGLAADVLASRPWTLRFLAAAGWVMLLGAAGFASEGVVLLATGRPTDGLAQGVVALIDSGVFLLGGLFARRGARQFRLNVAKALQLNQANSPFDA